MRAPLCAVLAALVATPAAACTFPAFSLNQSRDYEVHLTVHVDGELFDTYRFTQSFTVDYDAQLSTDGSDRLTRLFARPRDPDPAPVDSWNLSQIDYWHPGGGDWSVLLRSFVPDDTFGFSVSGTTRHTTHPVDGVSVDNNHMGIFDRHLGRTTGFSVYLPFQGGLAQRATLEGAAGRWVVNSPAQINPLSEPHGFFHHIDGQRYVISVTEHGWAEATIPLSTPGPIICYGDLDRDGRVDQGDLDFVLLGWGEYRDSLGTTIHQGTLDGVLLYWGDTSPAPLSAGSVPEPATILLLALLVFGVACTLRPGHRRARGGDPIG